MRINKIDDFGAKIVNKTVTFKLSDLVVYIYIYVF